LAGTFTALRLVQQGVPCVLVHQPQPHDASAVAAGLFNVATGQRAALTWQAQLLLDELYAFFDALLFAPLRPHLHAMPIYRPFATVHLCNEWSARSAQPDVGQLVSVSTAPWRPEAVANPLGGLTVHRCGWLNVPAFLQAAHALLRRSGLCTMIETRLDYLAIDTRTQTVHLQGATQTYAHIVFAEGVGVNQNPLRPFRPLQPLKGELLVVQLDGMEPLDRIVVGGVYVLPRADGTYIVGSTYEKHFTDTAPSAAARAHLLQRLQKLLPAARIRVADHLSGVRPTTPDRRPIIGAHPAVPGLWFFNGLGTKGVLQSPYLSRIVVYNLVGKSTYQPAETSLLRACLQPSA
jgi:glycine/D-amino acid oxidase-like deaminating enzyme